MRDTELYAQILGVQSPWNVDCVDFLKDKKSDGNDLLKGTKYDWLRNGNTKRKHGQRRHGAIFLAGCVGAGEVLPKKCTRLSDSSSIFT